MELSTEFEGGSSFLFSVCFCPSAVAYVLYHLIVLALSMISIANTYAIYNKDNRNYAQLSITVHSRPYYP
jgi:hypothetical protein